MTFGVIGYGRFGKLWARCLEAYGEVKIYDKNLGLGRLEDVLTCDYLFVLVPIGVFEEVCESIRDRLNPETVVVDACSVKMHPAQTMRHLFGEKQNMVATHPLFGPDSVARLGLAGRKMVLCPLKCDDKKLDELKKMFSAMQLEIFECCPEEHDEQMARSQALVHFLGRGLAALHLEKQDLYTPDYEALLRIHEVVNNDTLQLFLDMQRYNPFAAEVREKLLEKLERLNSEIAESTDIESARRNIDQIDAKIIYLLGERFKETQKIGAFKKVGGQGVLDEDREANLKSEHARAADASGVDGALVEKVFEKIMETSRDQQSKL